MITLLKRGLTFLILLSACASQNATLGITPNAWHDDLRYLARELPGNHANAFHTVSRKTFDAEVARLDVDIPSLNGDEVLVGFMRVVALIGDGHTHLDLPPNSLRYPIEIQWFDDELRVIAAQVPYHSDVGATVLSIGSTPVREAMSDEKTAIANIDFFGYGHVDVVKLQSVLPIRPGESINQSEWSTYRSRIEEAIRSETGKPPTDVALLCCNENGNSIIYIGVAGTSSVAVKHKRAPIGEVRLPAAALKLSQETDEALRKAAIAGRTQQDHSNGYALSADPELRAKELQIREFALANEDLLRRVLSSSSDAEHRAIAAQFLGYVNVSARQIADLVEAARDADAGVRNNAVRALGVIASSSQHRASVIPPKRFIALLKSDKWVDRNKGGQLMISLTASRNPKLLKQLRKEAMDALVEMARWRFAGHAGFARRLLGRIAGIEEAKLDALINDQAEAIIAAAQKSH